MTTKTTCSDGLEKEILPKEIANSWQGLLNLLVVYIVWGSTYLAIQIAVQGDGGFPPYVVKDSQI